MCIRDRTETVPLSVNAKASLTARVTARAVTQVGVSDPAVCEWKCRRSTDKMCIRDRNYSEMYNKKHQE